MADVVPEVEAIWRLFVVDDESAEPRLLEESGRWLQKITWHPGDSAITQEYFTFVEGEGFTFGYWQFDVVTGEVAWDFQKTLGSEHHLSPDATRFAVLSAAAVPGLFPIQALSISTPGAKTLELEGFRFGSFPIWSPDGRYLIAVGVSDRAPPSNEPPRDYFLIEPGGDEVVLLGRAPRDRGPSLAWSPDGSTVALGEEGSLVLFEVATRRRDIIPTGLTIQSTLGWSADGRYIAVGDGLFDVGSRSFLLSPTDASVIDSEPSPGGSGLAATLDIFAACGGLQANQTVVIDVSTAGRHNVTDCDSDGVALRVDWLTPVRFLLSSGDCFACDGSAFGLHLVSLPSGGLAGLTEGREPRGTFAISPSRDRVLVGGNKLRLYDSSGGLLRVIEPPPGYSVTSISWSNDGMKFAYVVGPTRVNLI